MKSTCLNEKVKRSKMKSFLNIKTERLKVEGEGNVFY